MKPSDDILKRIRQDKIDQANRLSPIDRLLAGPRLHDIARQRMRMGLTLTHPDATPEQAERIIRERFARQRDRDAQPWTA